MPTYGGGWHPSTTNLFFNYVGGGLVADAGEYLGPWPPDPILVQNLPDDAREIDYLIALPPPSGDITQVASDSYSTVAFHEWIYRDAGAGTVQSGDSGIYRVGNAQGTALPEGAHLYVGWYAKGTISQPAESPQQLVPQGWTIAARGWTRGQGKWSDWQNGYEYTARGVVPTMQLANTLTSQNNTLYLYDQGLWPDIDHDIRGMVDDVSAGRGLLAYDGTDWVPNFGNAPPDAPDHVPIRWDLAHCEVDIVVGDGWSAYTSWPGPFAYAQSHYVALTFDAADADLTTLPFSPPPLPDNAKTIPVSEQDGRTVGGVVQFAPGHSQFTGWADVTFAGQVTYETDDVAANPTYTGNEGAGTPQLDTAYFTPPTDLPLFFGVTDPIAPISANPGTDVDGRPLYVGPALSLGDLEPLHTAHFDIFSGTPPNPLSAPFTYDWTPAPNVVREPKKTIEVSVDVPFSSVHRSKFTVVAACGYFAGDELPLQGPSQPFLLRAIFIEYGAQEGSFLNDRTVPAVLKSPRWRYWTYDLIPPVLLPGPSSEPQGRNVAWV